jgi:hypothetical protein
MYANMKLFSATHLASQVDKSVIEVMADPVSGDLLATHLRRYRREQCQLAAWTFQ